MKSTFMGMLQGENVSQAYASGDVSSFIEYEP
jgi:hypothetical protein